MRRRETQLQKGQGHGAAAREKRMICTTRACAVTPSPMAFTAQNLGFGLGGSGLVRTLFRTHARRVQTSLDPPKPAPRFQKIRHAEPTSCLARINVESDPGVKATCVL